MRLWHQELISLLPRQQLLGQHRECCALRGRSWGKKHSVVDYVFTHRPEYLVAYHSLVLREMERRGYKPDPIWYSSNYRGKAIGKDNWVSDTLVTEILTQQDVGPIFPEHDDEYLVDCLENLRSKGIDLYNLEAE